MQNPRDELVRIDKSGQAHPIGTVASQRMRAREGTYRLLPGPTHVVFMRYTGEDGQRDVADGEVVRLAGEITAPGMMCDVLALVGQAAWRGELCVMDRTSRRSIFFDQGNIVGVQTSIDSERLGAVLYRYGALTQAQHDRVMEQVSVGKRVGEAAVELGFLARNEVFNYIRRQAEEVVFATLTVGDGTFYFLDGFDETKLVSQQVVSANALLMDSVTRMDEMRYFRQRIPSADHVPCRIDEQRAVANEFSKVYAAIDGRASVEDIGRFSGLGEFETTKQLYALMQSKHVVMRPPPTEGGPGALVATANDVLAALFAHMNQAGKQDEFEQSMRSFAVGAGVYDILFRNAGPDEHGRLEPHVVADNAVILAGGADPETVLKQMLHDYVSFALFSAGAILGRAAEASLGRELAETVASLRPHR
jgi:hypothetical protein